MTEYHVFIDIHVDREHESYSSRDRYKVYGRTYCVYCLGEYKESLLLGIGRAIERKENSNP